MAALLLCTLRRGCWVCPTYAASGGIGPRLYDALIGQAAVVHGIPAIVTWNVGHMRGLFPDLDVATPGAFIARRRQQPRTA